MKVKEISERLSHNALEIAQYLLPKGKRIGQEWAVGSLEGEAGQSLRIHISGTKAGVWKDFSSDAGGDLIDLWAGVKNITLHEAILEAKQYLGINEPKPKAIKKSYKRPEPIKTKIDDWFISYLDKRELSTEASNAYRVGRTDDKGIAFPQYSPSGELLNIKYLKPRRATHEKNSWSQEKDAQPSLFGWQAMTGNERWVVITEGEIDALTVWQCGYPALSVPSGAKNVDWIEHEYDNLSMFEYVVLWMDDDEAGRKGQAAIAERLGESFCKIAKSPLDPNDLYRAEGDLPVREVIDQADYAPRNDVIDVADAIDEIHDYENRFMNKGIPMPFPSNYKHDFSFRNNEMTVWTGINNHGKSISLRQCICHFIMKGQRCILMDHETDYRRSIIKIARQSIGRVDAPIEQRDHAILNFLGGNLFMYVPATLNAGVKELLKAFEYARARYGCRQFIIDNFLGLGASEEDLDKQRDIMHQLVNFKKTCNGHLHLVVHPRKGLNETKMVGKMDVRGSGAITDLADNVITVWRNTGEKETAHDGIIQVIKQREGDDLPVFNTYYNRGANQLSTHPNEATDYTTGVVYEQQFDEVAWKVIRGRAIDEENLTNEY